MAFSYTLATLKTAITAWLEMDSDTEFAASLNDAINLAEAQIVKDLPFSIFDEMATGTLTSATLTKPSGWVGTLQLLVTVSGAQELLDRKPWDYVKLYGGTGTPLYYAEESETTITVAPVPTSQAYTLRYIKRPTTLVETADPGTTWISANVPDLLFWATIARCEHLRKADERIAAAQQMYAQVLAVTLAKPELEHLIRRVR